jgi:hypothetical protein
MVLRLSVLGYLEGDGVRPLRSCKFKYRLFCCCERHRAQSRGIERRASYQDRLCSALSVRAEQVWIETLKERLAASNGSDTPIRMIGSNDIIQATLGP